MMELVLAWLVAYLSVGIVVATVQFIRQYKFNMFMIKHGSLCHSYKRLAMWWCKLCLCWFWIVWKDEN